MGTHAFEIHIEQIEENLSKNRANQTIASSYVRQSDNRHPFSPNQTRPSD